MRALRHGRLVVLADGGHAWLERRLVHVFQQHGNAGVGVGHRDAAAHRPGADHRGAFDLRRPACPWARREPSRLRDRRRTCARSARDSVRDHTVRKQLALARGARLEIQRERAFDGVDGLERRAQAFAVLARCAARRRARGDAGLSVGDLAGQFARLADTADVAVDCANLTPPSSRSPCHIASTMPAAAPWLRTSAFRRCTFRWRVRRRRAAAAAACRRRLE